MNFNVIIMTCDRPVNYLSGLVSALLEQGIKPVISQGSMSNRNLTEMNVYPTSLLVKTLPAVFQPDFQNWNIRQKHIANSIHCFRLGISMKKPFIILQDDVQPAKLFAKGCEYLTTVLAPERGAKAVSIYSPYADSYAMFNKVFRLCYYNPSTFYGTQGVWYDHTYAPELADYLEENLFTAEHHDDIMLNIYWRTRDFEFYQTSHSLVEHIGRTSTGLGDGKHTAAMFLDNFEVTNL